MKGRCALCGETKELSEDHVPPRSAFNNRELFLAHVEIAEANGELRWKPGHSSRRGNVYRSLCPDCNNFLGTRYNRAYVDFIQRIAEAG